MFYVISSKTKWSREILLIRSLHYGRDDRADKLLKIATIHFILTFLTKKKKKKIMHMTIINPENKDESVTYEVYDDKGEVIKKGEGDILTSEQAKIEQAKRGKPLSLSPDGKSTPELN